MSTSNRHPDERKLSLFAAEDLAAWERWLIGRHVAKCPECIAVVSAHSRVRAQLLAESPVPQADFKALAHRIRVEAAHATGPATRERGWRWTAAAGLAAAAIAVVLVLPDGSLEAPPSRQAESEPSESPLQVPVFYEGMEAQVTAEGTLSVRSFHPGSGVMTVTDYYMP